MSRHLRLSRRGAVLGGAAAGATLLAGGAPAALAQLRVDITKGVVQPVPIAVSPFAGDSPADVQRGLQIAELVQNDLDGSGLFKTIDRQAYIQSPADMRSGLPRFPDWRQINAQARVSTSRRIDSIASNSGCPQISGGASWMTGSPRSSARQ